MRKIALLLAALLLVPTSCTHRLSVDNFPEVPFAQQVPGRALAVGVVDAGGGEFSDDYVRAVAEALGMQAAVSRVVYPYVSGAEVDVIANVAVDPEYKGAGTNFLVNWPGFSSLRPRGTDTSIKATRAHASNSSQREGRRSANWTGNTTTCFIKRTSDARGRCSPGSRRA